MKTLLFLLAVGMITILTLQLKKSFDYKDMANYYKEAVVSDWVPNKSKIGFQDTYLKDPIGFIKAQIDYTGQSSVPKIITSMMILAILGSTVGLVLKNLFMGVVVATILGALPIIHLVNLERKMQILITETMPSFLAGLKTEFQLKNSLKESFIAMEQRVSTLIQKEYKIFISELDQNVDLHEALYKLSRKLRCRWFGDLGDIAEIIAQRQDKSGVVRVLDDLSQEVEDRIRQLKKDRYLALVSGIYVVAMMLLMAASLYIVMTFIEDPLIYFVSEQGRKHISIGLTFLLPPVLIYFYRVLREVS